MTMKNDLEVMPKLIRSVPFRIPMATTVALAPMPVLLPPIQAP